MGEHCTCRMGVMGLIYTTQSDVESWCTCMLFAHDSPKQKSFHLNHFFCLFYTFYFYFASMFLSSTGNLPSQTLNILYCDQQQKFSWYRMGDLIWESSRNRTKSSFFHFFIPPRNNICFVCRAKGKLLLQGPQLFTKALKEYGVPRWLDSLNPI